MTEIGTATVNLEMEIWLRLKGADTMHQVGTMTANSVDLDDLGSFVAEIRAGFAEAAVHIQPLLSQDVTVNVS